MPLVLDLRIAHDRWGSSSDPSINGHLHYPNDIDRSLNETVTDKTRKYRADYNNNPPSSVAFMPIIASTSGRLHSEFVRLVFLQAHQETDRFFPASGVQLAQSTSGLYHCKRAAFSSQLKSKCGNILAKAAALRITLNVDDAPVASRSHTHPSHSQTARLLTSSMSSLNYKSFILLSHYRFIINKNPCHHDAYEMWCGCLSGVDNSVCEECRSLIFSF